jgi:hypothetical protein
MTTDLRHCRRPGILRRLPVEALLAIPLCVAMLVGCAHATAWALTKLETRLVTALMTSILPTTVVLPAESNDGAGAPQAENAVDVPSAGVAPADTSGARVPATARLQTDPNQEPGRH